MRRFGYEWDALVTERGFVGVIVDLKYNKMNAQLSAPLVAQTYERNVLVPTIGGIWRGYVATTTSITAELTWLKFNHGEVHAKAYDYDIYGTGNFGRHAGMQFGYRSLKFNYDADSDAGVLKLKGPYIGLLVRF